MMKGGKLASTFEHYRGGIAFMDTWWSVATSDSYRASPLGRRPIWKWIPYVAAAMMLGQLMSMSAGTSEFSSLLVLELLGDVLIGSLAMKLPIKSLRTDFLLLAAWVALKHAAGMGSQAFTLLLVTLPMEWLSASCFQEMQEQVAMNEKLLEAATDGHCVVDRQTGKIVSASPGISKNLGMDPAGTPLLDFVDPRDWSKVTDMYTSVTEPFEETFLTTLNRMRSPLMPPTHEFDVKLVPHGVSGSDLHVCMQIVGEVRELGISFNISEDGNDYTCDSDFAGAMSRSGLKLQPFPHDAPASTAASMTDSFG
eukprot:CAMPEP_0179225166 /NCGR_PEP_ID=MMETSP0797-20121207/8171_1 /TAXON_ID=47934 /ORGANISM="Dinophysis acuminata, Strain DAEP01" /LENGTH=309 /DNA_ID=CAMNT_0020932181 /DNA_START=47 /DNA_END=972 /DNA_ORIENTATION=-